MVTPDALSAAEAKRAFVRRMFDGIAGTYDLLNHLLSGGADILWRRQAVDDLQVVDGWRILDLATGTGDLAFEAAGRASGVSVFGADVSRPMLRRGLTKESRRQSGVRFLCGDAERLPFADRTFDGLTIGFGIRNVADLDVGIKEMHRVLKPGARLAVLEFSRPRTVLLSQLYFLYFRCLLPVIGRLISGHTAAYRYLYESVMRFPEGQAFRGRMERAGFTDLREHRLTLGIATAYLATRSTADARGPDAASANV